MAPFPSLASRCSPISALTMASDTNSPASITALAWRPTGVPALTAARSMSPVDSWTMPRLAIRRCACVPLPAPGGPRRMMSMAYPPCRPRRSAPLGALQLRLLDEVAILVGDQVALDLADRVHGDVDNDEQAGAAEREIDARLGRQDLRNQADDGQVGRANHGDAIEQIVEIMLGRLARANAGDEAAVPLQILG